MFFDKDHDGAFAISFEWLLMLSILHAGTSCIQVEEISTLLCSIILIFASRYVGHSIGGRRGGLNGVTLKIVLRIPISTPTNTSTAIWLWWLDDGLILSSS